MTAWPYRHGRGFMRDEEMHHGPGGKNDLRHSSLAHPRLLFVYREEDAN
jgi:hypothetical protein